MSANNWMWCDKCEKRFEELPELIEKASGYDKEELESEYKNLKEREDDFESIAYYGQPQLEDDGTITLKASASCCECGMSWSTKNE